ncbi:11756_t:CDS:2 [Entrophospora sp. SA101]|nr:11756_t:CDS:2 [Entrophospora sp. SA101]
MSFTEGVVEKNKGVKRKAEENTWTQTKNQRSRIISMRPPSTYCKIHEYDPDVICNYRPNGSNIPISVYNHIFGNFKDRLSAKEVNIGNYKIGGEDGVIEYLGHGCTADGAILYTVGRGQCALLILEVKNEIGSGGPWLGISGAVFGEKIIIEPLTPMIPFVEEIQQDNTENKIPQQWVVKFVQNYYGKEVHEFCYQKKLAPRLFAVQNLCDNWKMVVMEYLLPDKFESLDSYVSNLQYNEKEKIKGKVMKVAKILHDENYVHGDLHLINMMISITNLDEYELRIVDFDWSGRDSNVKYPLLINSEVSWHQGVTGGAPIKKEHDIQLLKNGFKSLGFEILD